MSEGKDDDIKILGVKSPDGEVKMFKSLHEKHEVSYKFFPGAGNKLG